ncbi:hypothetical protein [Altererythrobacter fulvus]|uniref:hypothetical protein n=1 Tax=Caenibius fulvus TaxID=2126012 RepID=UPI00301B2AE8
MSALFRTHSPATSSSELHSHKSHPAGRGWISAARDVGLPGEGPDAAQAAFAGLVDAEALGAGAHSLHTGFTPERRMRFCERLAGCGNVRLACAMSGISAMTAYRARRRDGLFAQVWDRALALARDHAEAVLADRALEGIAEPVFHGGEVVGYRRRYESRLLLAHLARLDRRCDALDGGGDQLGEAPVEAFDLLLARLGAVDAAEDALPAREEHVAHAGAAAERAALAEIWPEEPDDGEVSEEDMNDPDWEGTDRDDDHSADECAEDNCVLAAGSEARERAGEEWDAAHASLCARLDALCDEPCTVPDAVPGEVEGEAGDEVENNAAVAWDHGEGVKQVGAPSGANGSVTGVTRLRAALLRQASFRAPLQPLPAMPPLALRPLPWPPHTEQPHPAQRHPSRP